MIERIHPRARRIRTLILVALAALSTACQRAVLNPAGGAVAWAELRSTRQTPPGIVRPDSSGTAATLVDQLGRADFPRTYARVSPDGQITRP